MKKLINLILSNKALVIIILIATFLRMFKIDFQSLWMDEIYTMNVSKSSLSFSEVISQVNSREGFPYLYFLTMNVFFTIFGDDSIVARLPSVIFGVASVFMIYKTGKILYNKNTGLIAAFLLATNEFSIYYSQEARPYAFYILCLLICFYFFIKFIKDNNQKNTIYYALSIGLLLNSNFFALLNVFAQVLILLLGLFFLKKDEIKQHFYKYMQIAIIALLMFAPNINKFFILFSVPTVSWIPQPTPEGLKNIFIELISGSQIVLFLTFPLFVFYLINIFKTKGINTRTAVINNKEILSFIVISFWIFGLVCIMEFVSYTRSSLYSSRYFSSLLPAILLIFAIAFNNIKNLFIRYSYLVGITLFVLLNTIFVKKYYNTPLKSQFREASDMVKFYNPNKDVVYTSLKYWYDYFLNNHGQKFEVKDSPNLTVLVNEMKANPALLKSFWVVDGYQDIVKLSTADQQFLDTHFRLQETYDGLGAIARHYIKK